MIKIRTFLLISCVLFLCGCASIMSGSKDSVVFNSFPTGAEFLIKDENNKLVHHGTTPATVTLERGESYFDGQTYNIEFSKTGYIPESQKVDTSINGWYFGNFIFGGLLGFLIIDPATGAMWSLPDNVNVSLSPQSKVNSEETHSPDETTH